MVFVVHGTKPRWTQVNHLCVTPCITNVPVDLRPAKTKLLILLKGALVVVVEGVVVATTTAPPSTFDTRTKGHLRLSFDLRRPRSLGSLLRRGSGGNHHWVS